MGKSCEYFEEKGVAQNGNGINGVAATQAIADLLSALVVIPLGIRALKIIKTKETEDQEQKISMKEVS